MKVKQITKRSLFEDQSVKADQINVSDAQITDMISSADQPQGRESGDRSELIKVMRKVNRMLASPGRRSSSIRTEQLLLRSDFQISLNKSTVEDIQELS